MSSLIPRYGEFNAETLNTSFAALQTRYELGGNALANIASETLTASAAMINIPLTAGVYKYLRLMVSAKYSLSSSTSLLANNDASLVYDYLQLDGDGASPSVFPLAANNECLLPSLNTTPLSTEFWIFLTPTGFNLIGSGMGSSTAQTRYACVYRGGVVTSLQMTFDAASPGLYLAGTSYLLQGLPI